jgi:amino acid adenylation domain-containing protein
MSQSSSLKDRLDQLSPERRALLAKLIQDREPSSPEAEEATTDVVLTPDPAHRHDPFPLTDLQEAYWVGRSADLAKVASHSYVEVEGDLDVDRLEQAFRRLIDRHDMMRAVVDEDGRQRVLPDVPPFEIRQVDALDRSPAATDALLNTVRHDMSHQVTDTATWPLFDVQATRITKDRVRLHVSLDAMIFDGWSITILFREWATLYHNPDAVLDPVPVTFRDYVHALEKTREQSAYERDRAFWRERIKTLPPAPTLPLAVQPEDVATGRFVRRQGVVPAEVWSAVKARAASHGVTPTGVLATVYADVVALWSEESTFSLNVPQFNRMPLHPNIDRVVGEFASFGLVAVDVSGQSSFSDRASAIQRQIWELLEHQSFSGVEILREIAQVEGRPTGTRMPVIFTASARDDDGNDAYPTVAAAELGEVVYSINQTSQVWVDNHIYEHDGALYADFDVVEELLPEGMAEAMLSAFVAEVELLAYDAAFWSAAWPQTARRVAEAADLPMRRGVAGPEAPVPDIAAHELFYRHAAAQPNHPAVFTSSTMLTYGELAECANRWARLLQDRGLGAGDRVAIVMEKGWEQAVAAYAVLASGAAYVPVDADLPLERLTFVLQNSEAGAVLTQSHRLSPADAPDGVPVFAVNTPEAYDLDVFSNAPLPVTQKPDDLAFILYTSGSTGQPKGVMIEHRGLVNALVQTIETFDIDASDCALALTALHHDMSTFDLFGVLGAGGSIAIPDAGGRRDPKHWSDLMNRHGVTVWNSVPAMMEMLIAYAGDGSGVVPPSLRVVFMGGDWIPVTLPDGIRRHVPDAEIVSVGGPTETTLWNIWYPVDAVKPDWASIPYGKGIANTRYYIMSQNLVERPTWVPGEMCVAGVGVARGYWKNEEKTAEKFITHPGTGERIYRTGDLGCFRPDGTIEFLGRIDFQVQINGQRVELGEIEATLQRHSDVRSALVVAHDREGKKQLVAYIVPVNGARVRETVLRSFLAGQIPAYMVPALFVEMDAFPLTRNGKVDRTALPDPQEAAVNAVSSLESEPRTGASQRPVGSPIAVPSVELSAMRPNGDAGDGAPPGADVVDTIANIVAEVMNIAVPAPTADLLDELFADSLEMVRIGNRLEKTFGSRPRIDELFRLQTIEALAGYYAPTEAGDADGLTASPEEHGDGDSTDPQLVNYRVLLDPAERDAFKKTRPGVRRDVDDRPSVALAHADTEDTRRERYERRRSYRAFSLKPILQDEFGGFLSALSELKIDGESKFLYPSPGGLNPTQTYVHVKPGRIRGVDPGMYYYHPEDHRLVCMTAGVDLDRSIHIPFINTPMFDESAFSVFFVVDFDAIGPSYGEKSLHFATLEAGVLAHHLELHSTAFGIGLCQVGGLDFDAIRDFFNLGPQHHLIHSMVGGRVDPTRSRGYAENAEGKRTATTKARTLLQRVQQLSGDEAAHLLNELEAVRV